MVRRGWKAMAGHIGIAAAQAGPIHLANNRARVIRRLRALLREAPGDGAKLVVVPELALTTCCPRNWYFGARPLD